MPEAVESALRLPDLLRVGSGKTSLLDLNLLLMDIIPQTVEAIAGPLFLLIPLLSVALYQQIGFLPQCGEILIEPSVTLEDASFSLHLKARMRVFSLLCQRFEPRLHIPGLLDEELYLCLKAIALKFQLTLVFLQTQLGLYLQFRVVFLSFHRMPDLLGHYPLLPVKDILPIAVVIAQFLQFLLCHGQLSSNRVNLLIDGGQRLPGIVHSETQVAGKLREIASEAIKGIAGRDKGIGFLQGVVLTPAVSLRP